jgi:hypothetical protein
MTKRAAIVLLPLLLLAPLSCTRERSDAGARPDLAPASAGASAGAGAPSAVTLCPGVTADATGTLPAADAINAGLAPLAQRGGTLELPRGVYLVDKQLVVSGPHVSGSPPIVLRTKDASAANATCASELATLRAAPQLSAMNGMLYFDTVGATIERLTLDGNRAARVASHSLAAQKCASGEPNASRWGYNASGTCPSCKFLSIVSKNALCGTGLEITRAVDVKIIGSAFCGNGDHAARALWADGLTVLTGNCAEIRDNRFVDNSGAGLALGSAARACPSATAAVVKDNVVEQRAQAAFAGIALDTFDNTQTGDFTDALVSGNTIDCGAGAQHLCDYGISIGPKTRAVETAQYPLRFVKNGTVRGNRVNNALQGIQVDGADGLTIGGNTVTASGVAGDFACGPRTGSSYNVHAADVRNLHRVNDATSTDFGARFHACP